MNLIGSLLIMTAGLIIMLAISVAAIRLLTKRKLAQDSAAGVYEAIPSLLTPAERSFYGVLQSALSADYRLFAKVRLADIIRPVKTPNRSVWQSAFNRISGKHLDFVLCHPEHLTVVAAIELDDRSHEKFERALRDTMVDAALRDAGIPVLRVSAKHTYPPLQVREQIETLLHPRELTVQNLDSI